jgi:hypothetical protein
MADTIRSPRVPIIPSINAFQGTNQQLYESLNGLKNYSQNIHDMVEQLAQITAPTALVDRAGNQKTASKLGLVSWNNSDNLYSVQGPPDPNSDPTVPSPFQNYTGDILHATGGKAVGGRIATSV